MPRCSPCSSVRRWARSPRRPSREPRCPYPSPRPGRWRCCRPTSRPSPRASRSTSSRCGSTSPSGRRPGSASSPTSRGSARSCSPRSRTTRATSRSTPRASSGRWSRSTRPMRRPSRTSSPGRSSRPSRARASRPPSPASRRGSRSSKAGSTSSAPGRPGPDLPQAGALGETVRRRRATGGPAEKTFAALVGLELRPRRLRDAANLWSALESRLGQEARDRAWDHPDVAPSAADLDDPLGYVERRAAGGGDDIDAALDEILRDGDG